MNRTDHPTEPWEQAGYADVARVTVRDDFLEVQFANGDTASLPVGLLGLPHGGASARLNEDDDGLSVIVAAEGKDRVVSGFDLRSITDPAFGQEMRRRDAETARRMGLRLKAFREDRGLNQRDLANLVGMSPPQLSKIESGTYDLRVSTVRTLLRAMGADFADIAEPDAPEISQTAVRRRLSSVGVGSEFVNRVAAVTSRKGLLQLVDRVFEWSPVELLAPEPLPNRPLQLAIQFKTRTEVEADPASPAVRLAHAVSLVARTHTDVADLGSIPEDPVVLRTEAQDDAGRVTLDSLLAWAWGAGLRVVPAAIRGGVAGAVWELDGAPVVTLAESNPTEAFWLFDLGHEIGHVARRHLKGGSIVDVDEPRPTTSGDATEQEANKFALKLLLPDHTALLAQIRSTSGGHYLRFKDAVSAVAQTANVSPGLLGMVAAYELTDIGQNKDRWGSATNLAKAEGVGRAIVQRHLRRHLRLNDLSDLDRALVESVALAEP